VEISFVTTNKSEKITIGSFKYLINFKDLPLNFKNSYIEFKRKAPIRTLIGNRSQIYIENSSLCKNVESTNAKIQALIKFILIRIIEAIKISSNKKISII
jgi:hypothetical protein